MSLVGAIKCIVGDVGAGKTLKCVMDAILAAQSGRDVYLNFPLSPLLTERYPKIAEHIHYLDDFYGFLVERKRQAYEKPFLEFQDLFVVDEAWEIWNARRTGERKQIDFIDYISISRKLGLELLAVTQIARRVDPVLKDLVTVWITAKKIVKEYFTDGVKHEQLLGFRYEYIDRDTGKVNVATVPILKAIPFFPYYQNTVMTSGPMVPLGMDTDSPVTSPTVSGRAFERYKAKNDKSLKLIRTSIKHLGTEVRKVANIQKKDRNGRVSRADAKAPRKRATLPSKSRNRASRHAPRKKK